MNNIGIQSGLYFKYNGEGTIYFTDDRGSASPLDNPLVKEAVKTAKTFACLHSGPATITASEELVIKFSATLTSYSSKEVIEFDQALTRALNDVNMACYEDVPENIQRQITNNLARLIQWSLTQHNQVNRIKEATDINPGSWVSLLPPEQVFLPIEALLSLAAGNPLIMEILKSYFLNEALAKSAKELDAIHGKFIDRGEVFMDQSNDRIFTHQALGAHFEDIMEQDNAADLLPTLEQVEPLITLQAKTFATIAENVDALFKDHPEAFVILPSYMNPLLDNLKGRISEPLKEPIKARNFLWEIKKTETIVGYLFGSIHQLPQNRPFPLHSKIMNAFEGCDTLAVEIDPTNPSIKREGFRNVIESMDDVKREALRQHLEESLQQKIQGNDALIDACLQSPLLHSATNGTDMHFIQKAKERRLPIVSLEDIVTHTEAEKAVTLQKSNDPFTRPNDDATQIQKIIDDLLVPGLTEKLDMLWDNQPKEEKERDNLRNQKMVESINKLITSGIKPFAIAGVLHFAGPFAMHKLMESEGYTVQQIIVEET